MYNYGHPWISPSTSTDDLNIYENVYNYRRHVNNDFHYAMYDYFPRRPVNVYLHYSP